MSHTWMGGVVAAAGLALAPALAMAMPGVVPGETASMGLRVYHNAGVHDLLNGGGQVLVPMGTTVDLGANATGSGRILGMWTEIIGDATNRICARWWTEDGSPLVAPGATVDGLPVQFLGWEFGFVDQVDFGPWVDSITLISATISASDSLGADTFDEFSITSTIDHPDPWNGHGGDGTASTLSWAGANWIEAEYEYVVTPSPAGAGVLALAGGLALARRRRR